VINIVGARGVTIKGITVQNGHDGIFSRGGANFSLEDTIVQNNANEGVQVVGNSSVRIANCTVQCNDGTGILITRNSSADFQENIIVHNNHANGICVELSSSAIFQGNIEATNNVIEEIAISVSSSGVFSESTITANQNGRYGIFVASTSHLVIQSNTVIETKSNYFRQLSCGKNDKLSNYFIEFAA
jgi:Periplasmic copper-binding protein (NosD)